MVYSLWIVHLDILFSYVNIHENAVSCSTLRSTRGKHWDWVNIWILWFYQATRETAAKHRRERGACVVCVCVCVCGRLKYYLVKRSFCGQNACGRRVDSVVSVRKQPDGERFHGKLPNNNNLCPTRPTCCCHQAFFPSFHSDVASVSCWGGFGHLWTVPVFGSSMKISKRLTEKISSGLFWWRHLTHFIKRLIWKCGCSHWSLCKKKWCKKEK